MYSALNKLKIKILVRVPVNNFWMNVNWRLEANTIKKYYIISVIFEIAHYDQKNPSLCFHGKKKKKPEFKVKIHFLYSMSRIHFRNLKCRFYYTLLKWKPLFNRKKNTNASLLFWVYKLYPMPLKIINVNLRQ